MKSLQVVTPHMECIFNCPFCIAKGHKHHNNFVNNYTDNFTLWKNNLIKVIKENDDLKYVVITGTNEPMQSKKCVSDICDIVKITNKDIQLELQTHYYKHDDIYNKLDVVAYSIADIKLLDKIKPMGKIQRYVLIMTDSFNQYSLSEMLKLIPNSVKQITFKKLIDTNGVNRQVDEYINIHSINDSTLNKLIDDVRNYKGDLSIRIDLDCMNCEGRYKIFREDGNVYDDWG